MNYILSKKVPKVGSNGFIVGNRFIPIQFNKSIPVDGLIFYASLNGKTPDTSETGQTLIQYGTCNYEKLNNIQCCKFMTTDSYILSDTNITNANSNEYTCSLYFCVFDTPSSGGGDYPRLLTFGEKSNHDNSNGYFTMGLNRQTLTPDVCSMDSGNWPAVGFSSMNMNKWYHICAIYSNNKWKSYMNGIFINEAAKTTNNMSLPNTSTLYINRIASRYNQGFSNIAISSIRIYNRALSEDEIKILSEEFKIV